MDLESITADNESLEEGAWLDFYDGSKLKIASTDGEVYNSYLARLARNNRLKLDDANPKYYAIHQDITCEALAKHVLLDWKGITVGKKEVAYTHEVGKKALLSSPRLRAFVIEAAADFRNFQTKLAKEVKEP